MCKYRYETRAQIKLSDENEVFKEMSGPKISEDCG